jgi:hypothetical protein
MSLYKKHFMSLNHPLRKKLSESIAKNRGATKLDAISQSRQTPVGLIVKQMDRVGLEPTTSAMHVELET